MIMKKLILPILIFGFILASCEVEPVDQSLKGTNLELEVSDCEIDLTLPELPDQVDACVTEKGEDAVDSYFNINVSNTILAGDYDGWCVDQDLTLNDDQCFTADVFSSYETLPAGVFEKPENFDLVNWLLNQNFIGQTSTGFGGTYTFGDVQRAIWYLVDDSNCSLCEFLGPYEDARSLELVAAAEANGQGFEPGPGQIIAIVLIPTDGETQSVIIPYKLKCKEYKCGDTAFALGETCFLEEGFDRWGWVIGPIADGYEETLDVYAGAGQCNLDKGTLIGTVTVSYNGGEVEVDYNIDGTYEEAHVYAGNNMFPTMKNGKPTVAPGQFTIQDNLEGEIYVIVHFGGVCYEVD